MRDERELPWLAPTLQQWHGVRGHALILQGSAGWGVLELAVRLAQSWLCEGTAAPCDACASCHLAKQGLHPDLKLLMPEIWRQRLNQGEGDADASDDDGEGGKSKRKPSKDIRVEAIRQAIDWGHTTSARGRGKVLVLFPADAMNTVSANALLKTLEEPASGLRLLLCVEDPAHLLPTIRSRCQLLRLPPPPAADARRWLQAQGHDDAELLWRVNAGEPLRVEQTLAQGLTASAWRALPEQVLAGDTRLLATLDLPLALRCLQQLCHDAMARVCGAEPRYFEANLIPPGATLEPLAEWSRALAQAVAQQDHPWNAGVLLESLVLQGRQALSRPVTPGVGAGGARPRVGTLRS